MSATLSPGAPLLLTPVTRREQLEAHLLRNAPLMDLASLLAVLHSIGYSPQDIEYRSHLTTLHQPSLVLGIEFRPVLADPRTSSVAVITLNMGLLAPQSPLPSYVFRYLATQHRTSLSDFIGLCAHHLLRQVAESQAHSFLFAPQRRRSLVRQTLTLLGLTTPSTLHWLLEHAFPELEAEVSRSTQRIAMPARQITLGATNFGDGSSFGAQTFLQIPSLHIHLWTDGLHSPTGDRWTREVPARLAAWLWPLFEQHSVYVEVELHIRHASDALTLGPSAQLGYQPFFSPQKPSVVRHLLIFRGDIQQVTRQASNTFQTDWSSAACRGIA